MAKQQESSEKTCIKSTGLCGMGDSTNLAAVDIKDGKIVRIRPLPYDWKYDPQEFKPWKFEARGKVFEPTLKSLIGPLGQGYKKRVYSPNRILYPLKRVDWDPEGERHPENRGKSGYVRISWDEAAEIVASELKRINKKYGPYAVLAQADGHAEEKVVHAPHGCSLKLLNLLGGYTLQVRNPDSWEGWYWGSKHVWGTEPHGTMTPYHTNLISDVAKNTDILLFWGADPETTPWGFGGGPTVSRICYWFTELGIKTIYICPDLNYGAAVHADKWIPIRPNTDAAMQLAIAYLWITNGTFDKEYMATHTFGFDKFKEYVLGQEDGVPKTPKWAAEITGVPTRMIKELAREWASRKTTVTHCYGGPYIRGSYCHEPARLEVLLLAMQGVGKPGVHQLMLTDGMMGSKYCRRPIPRPRPDGVVKMLTVAPGGYRGYHPFMPLPKQVIPKTMIHEAILKGHFTSWGSSAQMWPAEDQFKKYVYPVPGCSPVHMIWSDSPCLMTCWNDSNSIVKAYRHPSIEFMVVQHPWLENDTLFADVILPVSTKYEEEDIGDDTESYLYDTIFLSHKCIEPIGESKSDYETVCLIAEKLGLLKEYTEGKSVEDWKRNGFEQSGAADLISWEKLKEKDYYIVPTDPDWKKHKAGMLEFYEDPEKYPLHTPSGKIEFYSQNLAKYFPDDKERPPVPHWIPFGESHQESLLHPRAREYPLLVCSNHPRHRVHAQGDDCDWLHEIPTGKVRGADGYLYEPVWINPADAGQRNIKNGDVVKVFNERGGVLVGAYITERIMPGVVYIDHGSRYDPIVPGELDRGGAINTITPYNITSKNCAGHVVSGFLVEVEPVNLEDLRKQYPEAFTRPYNMASGQKFERVLSIKKV